MLKKKFDYEKLNHDYIQMYFNKLAYIKDPISTVITIHLYTEFWLNQLIEYYSFNPEEILNFNFTIKLALIYNMGLIPKDLYKNIKKLNKLRNNYAHNLDYDYRKSDLNYIDADGHNMHEIIENETDERAFMYIGGTTFEWLATYTIEKFKKNF